ncbi:unnamed protein product [Lampetra planeri]
MKSARVLLPAALRFPIEPSSHSSADRDAAGQTARRVDIFLIIIILFLVVGRPGEHPEPAGTRLSFTDRPSDGLGQDTIQ